VVRHAAMSMHVQACRGMACAMVRRTEVSAGNIAIFYSRIFWLCTLGKRDSDYFYIRFLVEELHFWQYYCAFSSLLCCDQYKKNCGGPG
jgi:hypothetical protein